MSLSEYKARLGQLANAMEECRETDYLQKTLSDDSTILNRVADYGKQIENLLKECTDQRFKHICSAYDDAINIIREARKEKIRGAIRKTHPDIAFVSLAAFLLHRIRIDAIYRILSNNTIWEDPGRTAIGTNDGTDCGTTSAASCYPRDHIFFDEIIGDGGMLR